MKSVVPFLYIFDVSEVSEDNRAAAPVKDNGEKFPSVCSSMDQPKGLQDQPIGFVD